MMHLKKILCVTVILNKHSLAFSTSLALSSNKEFPASMYILDGTAMSHQAFHGWESKTINIQGKNGINCGSLVALARNVARFVKIFKPHYIVAAFDFNRITFRNDLYPQYKAQRPEVLLHLFFKNV